MKPLLLLTLAAVTAVGQTPKQTCLTPESITHPSDFTQNPVAQRINGCGIGLLAVGQTTQAPSKAANPVCGNGSEACVTYTTTSPWTSNATWLETVKDGIYTATFTDPNNKWRCWISRPAEDRDGITSFTMHCVDTTASTVPMPPKPTATPGSK